MLASVDDVPYNEVGLEEAGLAEKVHLLRFGSADGQIFRNALIEGPQFKPCRDALVNTGFSCLHPSGAIILVRPDQYRDVSQALIALEVHPFHVIITESLEYLLDEILSGIPCRRRPREKTHLRKALTQHTNQEEGTEAEKTASQEGQDEDIFNENDCDAKDLYLVETRTFMCVAPKLKDPQAVVQSTTEAVRSKSSSSQVSGERVEAAGYYTHFRGVNPRRKV